MGAGFVALIVILFAFSSIVANYIYAENNLIFLKLDNIRVIWLLRIATVCTVIGGTLISFPLVWQLADIIMACMAITNLTAILLLSPVVHTIASDYLRQRKLGVRRNSIRAVILISDNSLHPIAGMKRRANSAAIATIDQFSRFFAKVAVNFLQGLDMLILISPAKRSTTKARWQRHVIRCPSCWITLSNLFTWHASSLHRRLAS